MGDLWEFPYFNERLGAQSVKKELQRLKINVEFVQRMTPVTHTFTRFSAKLFPFYFTTEKLPIVDGYRWISRESIDQLSFSSGHRKIMEQLCKNSFS